MDGKRIVDCLRYVVEDGERSYLHERGAMMALGLACGMTIALFVFLAAKLVNNRNGSDPTGELLLGSYVVGYVWAKFLYRKLRPVTASSELKSTDGKGVPDPTEGKGCLCKIILMVYGWSLFALIVIFLLP